MTLSTYSQKFWLEGSVFLISRAMGIPNWIPRAVSIGPKPGKAPLSSHTVFNCVSIH